MSWMFDTCSQGCRMRRTIKLWEVFVTRFEEALERHRLGRLSAEEAGEALGMSGRQFRRLRVRYSAEGAEGLRDRRLGRASKRRAPEAELDRMHRSGLGKSDRSIIVPVWDTVRRASPAPSFA